MYADRNFSSQKDGGTADIIKKRIGLSQSVFIYFYRSRLIDNGKFKIQRIKIAM